MASRTLARMHATCAFGSVATPTGEPPSLVPQARNIRTASGRDRPKQAERFGCVGLELIVYADVKHGCWAAIVGTQSCATAQAIA